jgi:uncharacterized protein (TIGR02145 family)
MSSGNGTDNFGFSALPGGARYTDSSFYYVGSYGYWWSATESGSGLAWYRHMHSSDDNVYENNNGKGSGFSVVCVQD